MSLFKSVNAVTSSDPGSSKRRLAISSSASMQKVDALRGLCWSTQIRGVLSSCFLHFLPHNYFLNDHENATHRCVGSACGDSEKKQEEWHYDSRHRLCLGGGRGGANNWAEGFFLGVEQLDRLEEAVCREVEKCDRLATVWILASASGGTGSGVGCALADRLDDVIGRSSHRMHGMVLCSGQREDVTIGPLNATLALAKLLDPDRQRASVLALDNDEARRRVILDRSKQPSHIHSYSVCKPTIHDLNVELCASVLRPVVDVGCAGLDDVASHPNFHLLSASSTVDCTKRAQTHARQTPDMGMKVLLHPRGRRAKRAVLAIGGLSSPSRHRYAFNSNNPHIAVIRRSCDYLSIAPYHGKLLNPNVASVVATGGSGNELDTLTDIATRALAMTTAKAFIHHFEAHGVALSDVQNAIDMLNDVRCSYAAID